MTRIHAHVALRMLDALIIYIRKHGGNRDTYILDALRIVREKFIEVYGDKS